MFTARPCLEEIIGPDSGYWDLFVYCLTANEIIQFARTKSWVHQLLAEQEEGIFCPYLCPKSAETFAHALSRCAVSRLRILRPAENAADLGDPTLACFFAQRLDLFVEIEELGPICVDVGMPEQVQKSVPAENSIHLPVLPLALLTGLARCSSLTHLYLTLTCNESRSDMVMEVLPAISGCCNLRKLQLDADGSLSCGAAFVEGLASALEGFGVYKKLHWLNLGYIWWSEAAEEVMARIQIALRAFEGSIKTLTLRYSQDPEFGGLEAACVLVEGCAGGLEEMQVVEGWAENGDGLATLAETLDCCTHLGSLKLVGELPKDFNAEMFGTSHNFVLQVMTEENLSASLVG